MKAKIHPKYYSNLKITCSCGNIIIAGSTKETVHTEICSGCHPFYTGTQKLLDTAGRVDKFLAKVKKAQQLKEKSVKKLDKDLDELFEEPTEISKNEPAKQTQLLEFDEPKAEESVNKVAKKAKAPAKKANAKKK
jgi:large subunit ribosomal protein L31